ncbi:hypothetical protein [Streptosporangium sp. NPDC049078]|uniref:hypothetical protein n=1 Tax=Streptosporangium sp. NPDC049078 TaxID=3155767 RepID=UPI0034324006
MSDLMADLKFWAQIEGDSKRTLACSPADAPWVREAIEAAGWNHILTVIASPIVTDGQMIIMDVQAMDASFNEALQHYQPEPPW